MMAARKPRILFIAEAVTLAHVARPAVLAGKIGRASCRERVSVLV